MLESRKLYSVSNTVFKALILISCTVTVIGTSLRPANVVEISNGQIRGTTGISRSGKLFYKFLGIEYAKSPVGNLRFEPPVKPDNWTGIKDACCYKSRCIQYETMILGRIQGDEDCLGLNVFTPYTVLPLGTAPLPVMVFIFGGGFMGGSANMYKPKYLLEEMDVILVTFNYRVGSFGFLSSGPDGLISGNMGLKDQRLALQWVQENIGFFGGDPGRVTLFGESSGGSSVHLHMFSNSSKGLFHRAISESGSALRKYPNTKDFAGQFRNLASKVGCPLNETNEIIVGCLKNISAMSIVETHQDAADTIRSEYAIYGPSIESVKDENSFLTEDPAELLKTGRYNQVPWITGFNSADGIIFASDYVKDRTTSVKLETLEGWSVYLPRLLRFDDDDIGKANIAARRIREFYFGDASPTNPKYFQELTNMFSDRMYYLPSWNAINLQSKHSPVYPYYFDYKTSISIFKVVQGRRANSLIPTELQIASHFVRSWFSETLLGNESPYYGSSHADELWLLFNLNFLFEARPGTPDYDASRAMVKIWTDFAKNNSTDEVKFDGKLWPSVSANDISLQFLNFGSSRKISSSFDDVKISRLEERMRFWKSLNLTWLGQEL